MIDSLPRQKALPHSKESERAVLGAVLLDPSLFDLVSNRLATEDFYCEGHQVIFKAFLALKESAMAIDLRTLQAKLEQWDELNRIGGLAFLTGLDLDLPDIGRLDAYVEIVKERSARRAAILIAGGIIRGAMDGGSEAPQVLGEAINNLSSVLSGTVTTRLRVVREGLREFFDRLDCDETRRATLQGLPCGFLEIDALTYGLLKESLWILAGRAGMGKTTVALQIVRHVACVLKRRVAVFSLEMSEQELILRLLCAEAEVHFGHLRSGLLSRKEWERLIAAGSVLHEAPIWIDDTPALKMLEIEGRLRRLKAEGGLDLCVVDYLQLVEPEGRFRDRRSEIAFLSKRAKRCAREIGIPIIVLSQVNREPTRRSDPRPQLADLAESSSLENDSDVVVFVHRPEYYDPETDRKGLTELIVAKDRHGGLGTAELVFDKYTGRLNALQAREDPF